MAKAKFTAILEKFEKQGEKTGWTYIYIPKRLASRMSDQKTTFRVKGKIDELKISQVAILPMGTGEFILPVNGDMRKALEKIHGDEVQVEIDIDKSEIEVDQDLLDALAEAPKASEFFQILTMGHKNYFTKLIETAKTQETKAKRIGIAVHALERKLGFADMLREQKALNNL